MKINSLFEENNLQTSVVGIVGQRNFSVYFGILGALYSGCTYVPINQKYEGDRITKIIKESKVDVLIGNKESIDSIDENIINNHIKVILFPEEEFVENSNIFNEDIKLL